MYCALYDEKHRFHILTTFEGQKNKFEQKRIREKLLCTKCEAIISQYERYVSLVFAGSVQLDISRDGRMIEISGLNYSHFKLFALSILWRAGVSLFPIFKQVKLGPHEDVLRQMVLNGDPGPPEKYSFIVAPIMHDGKPQMDVIIQPTWTRLLGHYTYRFVFGGLAWVFLVSKHRPPVTIAATTVSRVGRLIMLETELEEMSFLMKMAHELKQKGKL